MAAEKQNRLNILTPEQRKQLTKLGDQVANSKAALALLEELGLGVGDLKSKLEWTEKRRLLLLEKG